MSADYPALSGGGPKLPSSARQHKPQRTTPADLLEFFYPVHYQIGTALEAALSGGVLSRKQVAILWLIRSEGKNGREMRRKEIEQALQTWFEISTSAVSKALREMHRAPLQFVAIHEDPRSGRERLVSLTPAGARFLTETTARAERYVAELVAEMSPAVLRAGAQYLSELTEEYHRLNRAGGLRAVDSKPL